MARGDVFVVGDRVEYRTSYKAAPRYGVVLGFGRHTVLVRFDGACRRPGCLENGTHQEAKEIKASAAWLRPRPVEIKGDV